MQKHTSETTDVEWVPQNLSQIPAQMGKLPLDFQHSLTGEKGILEKEWDPTMWSGLKHHCALVMEMESLSVT